MPTNQAFEVIRTPRVSQSAFFSLPMYLEVQVVGMGDAVQILETSVHTMQKLPGTDLLILLSWVGDYWNGILQH